MPPRPTPPDCPLLAWFVAAIVASASANARPVVITTNTILADMTREVAGEAAEVQCLVPAGVDLHGFDPTPRDIAPLLEADLVVANGAGFEPWLANFLGATGYSGPVVKATDGCALISSTDHDHGETDPHAWQDPACALRYVANIRDALCMADPSGAENYRRRASLYSAQIAALDDWARRLFALVPPGNRIIITSHDSLAYFGRAFALAIHPLRGLDARAEPDAHQVASIIDLLRAQKARALFVEAVSNPKMLEQISRDTGVTLGGELHTDSLSPTGSPAATYLGMLRENTLRVLAAIEAK